MCAQMRSEVWRQVRSQELSLMRISSARRKLGPSSTREAGACLLETYAELARRGEHLFGHVLAGQMPKQWAHYPDRDAVCRSGEYQWFYHSHSPEDRPGTLEHGHIHLFARRAIWGRRLQSKSEKEFASLCGNPSTKPNTRHLLAIGFDAKGIPISVFTINSWVTGDLMLGAKLTLELLSTMALDTGNAEIDAVIESTVRLCLPDLANLLAVRDRVLADCGGPNMLNDPALELLSETQIDLDARLLSAG